MTMYRPFLVTLSPVSGQKCFELTGLEGSSSAHVALPLTFFPSHSQLPRIPVPLFGTILSTHVDASEFLFSKRAFSATCLLAFCLFPYFIYLFFPHSQLPRIL